MAGGRAARSTDVVMKAIFQELAKPRTADCLCGSRQRR